MFPELLRRCEWGGCKWHACLFLLHLLPCCLCSLGFRSSLIWWLCESRVLSCTMQESPPALQGWLSAPSLGPSWYLWDQLWCFLILVQQKLAWSFLREVENSIFCPSLALALLWGNPHSRRIFKCIIWVGCKHKLRCFPKQNSSLVCFGPRFVS